jgi:outer membrane protein TolC
LPPFPANPQWFLSSSLQFGLNLNVATFTGIRHTLEEYEAGKISIERARLQLERDVRKSYYQILLAREYLAIMREALLNADRQVNMAQANFRGGLIPEVAMLQAQVARENLRPQIDEAENMYRMAKAAYAMLLGLPYDADFELAPLSGNVEFIILEADELIGRAASNRPEVEELRRNIAVLKAQRDVVFYNLFTPTLSLRFAMDPTFSGDPMNDNWFDSDLWRQRSGAFSITLAMRLNAFFPFSREAQSYRAINDGLEVMNIGMSLLVQGTQTEVYNTILQLERTRTSAEAQRATVSLAERTLQMSEIAYRNGHRQFVEVLNDELALRQARLGMLQQNYNYLMSLLDLEYAIGMPFGTLGGMN